ncbi:hypothetical protein KP509_07G070000 [Ceratopteris richardii]|uniref:mannosyl-glycoprotein endo-beta-N-acetylglucosaminidase n=3 Tax=Ceratopteris richardii TaxID=49495 RepID=A0A8T2UMC0_CERRI|nr:hypothetical protein KP509_07G070000 [Ceratopteris richardii]
MEGPSLPPASPESYPLRTLEELENLSSYLESFHFPFNKASVPLPVEERIHLRSQMRPRLLVCHDMKGGYQDDRWPQGSSNGGAYSIWHWHLIDIFVYFSHSLVTIPPPCWTNAAHRHGVQVLGTFITEWNAGKVLCKKLLESKESVYLYASHLTNLAEVLGFDGWLINIENNVEKHNVGNLLEFVRLLTELMHERVPGSTVIWYDSVTKDGVLRWQNCLNQQNKCFFDLCDGLFVNYTWKGDYPKKSAEMAGHTRQYDVYMGIDVFGRGTYGGGGYQSNLGLIAARNAGVSAALFAPGWVYETGQGPSFMDAQNRWWGLVADCWPSVRKYPTKLPFFSDFNQGFWKHYFSDGNEVCSIPWSNISCQNLQPFLRLESAPRQGALKCEVSDECPVYRGGACLKFFGSFDEASYCLTTLYETNIEIVRPFDVIYSIKSKTDSSLSFLLKMRHKSSVNHVLLDATDSFDEVVNHPMPGVVLVRPEVPVQEFQGWTLLKYKVENSGKLEAIMAVSCSSKQRVSGFIENMETLKDTHNNQQSSSWTGNILKQNNNPIMPLTSLVPYEAYIGHISMSAPHEHDFNREGAFEMPFEISNVCWKEASGKRLVNLKLTWMLKASLVSEIMHFNVSVQNENGNNFLPLGVAMVEAFYVYEFEVAEECHTLTFLLQIMYKCGCLWPINQCPTVDLLIT